MPRYKLLATQHWQYGERSIEPGDEVAEIESNLAPLLLFEGERSGRLQILPAEQVEAQQQAAQQQATQQPAQPPAPDA